MICDIDLFSSSLVTYPLIIFFKQQNREGTNDKKELMIKYFFL
ncbi:hypothetical protein pb186bvf_009759 [Paramecium bursaria]